MMKNNRLSQINDTVDLCISGTRLGNQGNTLTEKLKSNLFTMAHNSYYPGITDSWLNNADYASINARLSSFNGWNSNNVNPNELAKAGFYYTGIKDYVRCFFCGGGIKDWEGGDDPLAEHARCYPNCAFISQCQQNQQQVNICNESLIDDLNSVAANLVLDMGYNQEDVINAIRHSREQYETGSTELKAHQLLAYLLDNSCTNVPSTSQQTGLSNNTTNIDPFKTESELSSCFEETKGQISDESTLLEQNRQLKEQRVCKICLDKEACIVFLPCGHLVSCLQCSHALSQCAVCRTKIQDKIRVYQC